MGISREGAEYSKAGPPLASLCHEWLTVTDLLHELSCLTQPQVMDMLDRGEIASELRPVVRKQDRPPQLERCVKRSEVERVLEQLSHAYWR